MPIKIYTAPHCPHSRVAKKIFDINKIAYVELDVSKDESAYEEMLAASNQSGVPVIEIGNDVHVGFNEKIIKKAQKYLAKNA